MISSTNRGSKRFKMRWIIAGIFLTTILFEEAQTFSIGSLKSKRSMDLNDPYFYGERHHRRYQNFTPESYNLEIEPMIKEGKFKGRVRINVTCLELTNVITFNIHPDLHVYKNATVREFVEDETGQVIARPLNVVYILPPKTWRNSWHTITLQQMLNGSGKKYEVEMNFAGNLSTNEIAGFFRSEYADKEGQTHQFVGTYLRLNNAQKMFPCMLDPHFKAKFKLSVKHSKNMTSRSNTPVESITKLSDEPDMVWTHFVETPEIATYQLSLIVSDFESIVPTKQIDKVNGTMLDIRVWGRKDYLDCLREVPDKIVKIMNYLQNYFNCSIGLPKLDIMAVPMFNAVKASDSWGLMFFKESELSSPLIWNTAYELIYQWIGQYITPYSWNDAPLSKALNSFLASMTTVDINPEEMEGKWPMTKLYPLYYEFSKATPFLRVAGIKHEAISAKAELVFRMFNYTLGKDVIRNSVRDFIQQQQQQQSEVSPRTFYIDHIYNILYSKTTADANLPQSLTIESIASRWIDQNRLPLVTVIRDYELGSVNFSQKIYLRSTEVDRNSESSFCWDIPIVLLTEENLDFSRTYPSFWLTEASWFANKTITDVINEDSFIIVNPEEIGMFPVNYDPCNWKMLAEFLQGPKRETIPVLTRAKLLHDSWNLAYAGELCFEIALNMSLFLKNERSHIVWEPVFAMIDHVGRRIEGSPVYTKFEEYIRLLLEPLYVELGDTAQPGEPSWKVHLRGLAKNFLCRAGYVPCIKEAKNQYSKWLNDQEPDKGNPVANEFICPVFKWGTYDEWEFGLQRVINFPRNSMERKQNERTYLLKTLAGCPKDPYKIERLLNVTILEQNGNFSDSDIHLILSMLTGRDTSYITLFDFLNEHWDTVKQRFENKKYLWQSIINYATSSFNTQEGYNMVSTFYGSRYDQFDTVHPIMQKVLRSIRQEIKWSEKNLPIIDEWLDANLPKEDLQEVE